MDGVVRAESIVIDLEQTSTPVLIITHVSMMRILYAYFKSIPVDTVTDLNFPQGLVVEFKPRSFQKLNFDSANISKTTKFNFKFIWMARRKN
ncbi:hypothetical protein MHBO_001842 [Bonamia ostreae]|uniref:Phosphoglycerate mutase n=1 Tax=Bonamia ostreae TaxID=126728 RepID=A0ABV2AKC3_9EUKA